MMYKEARKQLKNCNTLRKTDKSLRSIYEIVFAPCDNIMCETSDGYRIYTVTYDEARTMIEKAASVIHKEVGSSEYIGIDFESSIEWIVSFWAIIASGNKPYLINRRYPKHLTEHVMDTLNVKYVIACKETVFDREIIDYTSFENGEAGNISEFGNEIALSTSGTSLNETICTFSGQEISEQILDAMHVIGHNKQMATFYKGRLKHLVMLPFYHIFGLTAVYIWFAFFHTTFVFPKDLSGDTIMKTCRKHEITHCFSVPMFWHAVEDGIKKQVAAKGEKTEKKFYKALELSTRIQNVFPSLGIKIAHKMFKEVTDKLFGNSLAFAISGGGFTRDSTFYMMNALGYPIHNGFGMTEIGITSVELSNYPKYRNMNSNGMPFPSIEYRICDGVLFVRGKSTCKKVIVNGETMHLDGWLDTGDLFRQDETGRYYILGRKSNVIIGESGENVNPDMLEKHFALPYTDQFCIFGHKKGECAEVVAMVIYINEYRTAQQLREIVDAFNEQNGVLPITSAVREVFFTYQPLRTDGAIKISRSYLKKCLDDGSIKLIPCNELIANAEQKADDFDPTSSLAIQVTEIVAEALNLTIEEVAPDKHIIFDLGGTSFEYFAIISEINNKFRIELTFDTGKESFSVKSLCDEIRKRL